MIVRLDRQTSAAVEALAASVGCSPAQAIKAAVAALYPGSALPTLPSPDVRADGALMPVHAWYVQFWGKPLAFHGRRAWCLQTIRVQASSPKRAIRLAKRGFRIMPGVHPGSPRFLVVRIPDGEPDAHPSVEQVPEQAGA